MALTAEETRALLEELEDRRSGVNSHVHTSTKGEKWRCTSPYCDRGGDVRDEPQPAPNETQDQADARYVRTYA